jgi:O-antigen ligase
MTGTVTKQTKQRRREATLAGKASASVRRNKIVCALALSVCFWFSVPYRPLMQGPEDLAQAAAFAAETNDGALSRQIALPIIAVIGLYMLWRLPHRGRFGGGLRTAVLLFAGWALLSVAWSESPSVSAKRLVVFALDAFFAYALARTFSVIEMALWGFATTGVVALLALYVDLIQQRIFSPFDPDYRFAGVMQPNYQAMNLTAGILCGLTLLEYLPARRAGAKRMVCAMLAVAAVLLFLTRSRLSAALCVVFAAYMLVRMAREAITPQGRARVVVAGLLITVPAGVYLVGQNAGGAVQSVFMMGRADMENTSSLSNRAPLWSELLESAEKRPLIGFGYGAFWTPERLQAISFDQGWIVPHAHNTYLDQALSLGIVGMLLYMAALWSACTIAWRRYREDRSAGSLLAGVLLSWIALEGVAESVPLDPYLPTMLAYACLVKMCMLQGSEAESDVSLTPGQVIGGWSPDEAVASVRPLALAERS